MAKEVYIDSNGNEIPINSAPTYASQIPLSPIDDTDTASAIEANKVKSVFLTTTYNCSYSDSNTIGYRGTGPNITTLTGYPTDKNILAVVIERSYVDNKIYPAITSLDTNVLYTESKNSGTAYIGMRVLYTD
jgi:hypothetical protein